MSEQQSMFADAPVVKQKPIYCVGVISELSELKLTAPKNDANGNPKTQYLMLPFKIKPLASGQASRGQVLLRPEWIVPGFNPTEEFDTDSDAGKSALRVYQSNIKAPKARQGSTQAISQLAGLCGTEERWNTLAGKLLGLGIESTAPGYINALNKIFQDFLFPNGAAAKTVDGDDIAVGYKLVQQREKNEETGKYEDRSGYQLGEFFYPTDAVVDKLREDAAEKGTFKVGF